MPYIYTNPHKNATTNHADRVTRLFEALGRQLGRSRSGRRALYASANTGKVVKAARRPPPPPQPRRRQCYPPHRTTASANGEDAPC
jgi:hypothetical protein